MKGEPEWARRLKVMCPCVPSGRPLGSPRNGRRGEECDFDVVDNFV